MYLSVFIRACTRRGLQNPVSRAVGQRIERNRRTLPLPAQRPDAGLDWRRVGTKQYSFNRSQKY